MQEMSGERVTLQRQGREYFAEIGRRGGRSGWRELTRQQAKLMVVIREAKRLAEKKGQPPPKIDRKQQQILRKPKLRSRA